MKRWKRPPRDMCGRYSQESWRAYDVECFSGRIKFTLVVRLEEICEGDDAVDQAFTPDVRFYATGGNQG